MSERYFYETIIIMDTIRLESEQRYIQKIIELYKFLLDKISPASEPKYKKLGKRNLAYDINKCHQGWYVLFTNEMTPTQLKQFEAQLRIDDDVMKFISVRIDEADIFDKADDYYDNVNLDLKLKFDDGSQKREQPVDIFDLIFGLDNSNNKNK